MGKSPAVGAPRDGLQSYRDVAVSNALGALFVPLGPQVYKKDTLWAIWSPRVFEGVHKTRALLLGVYIRANDLLGNSHVGPQAIIASKLTPAHLQMRPMLGCIGVLLRGMRPTISYEVLSIFLTSLKDIDPTYRY